MILNFFLRSVLMIYVGIDTAKDKLDCCIMNSDSKVLFKPFTIRNNRKDFDELYSKVQSVTSYHNSRSELCAMISS